MLYVGSRPAVLRSKEDGPRWNGSRLDAPRRSAANCLKGTFMRVDDEGPRALFPARTLLIGVVAGVVALIAGAAAGVSAGVAVAQSADLWLAIVSGALSGLAAACITWLGVARGLNALIDS
jgi:hypothetical protein